MCALYLLFLHSTQEGERREKAEKVPQASPPSPLSIFLQLRATRVASMSLLAAEAAAGSGNELKTICGDLGSGRGSRQLCTQSGVVTIFYSFIISLSVVTRNKYVCRGRGWARLKSSFESLYHKDLIIILGEVLHVLTTVSSSAGIFFFLRLLWCSGQ